VREPHKQQEKAAYLRETLAKLAALKRRTDIPAAQALARDALDRYPRVTAFQIAHAHFAKHSPGPESSAT